MTEAYLRPDTLDEALAVLADGETRIAAGCTDLLAATARKILPGRTLDISRIPTLRGILHDDSGLTIGATTTWTDIATAELPPACRGLQLAAREVGGPQIQNRGTIAGNLCNASPAADGVPPLLTLDAQVVLQTKDGERSLPLDQFLTGPRRTAREAGEIVVAIRVPTEALEGAGHFLKLGARRHLVISIAMVSVRVSLVEGTVKQAAVAVGACGPVAVRLTELEKTLVGQPLDPRLATDDLVAQALSPIDDVRADAPYRTRAAAELVQRALAQVPA